MVKTLSSYQDVSGIFLMYPIRLGSVVDLSRSLKDVGMLNTGF